jgi:hypothetical protein
MPCNYKQEKFIRKFFYENGLSASNLQMEPIVEMDSIY